MLAKCFELTKRERVRKKERKKKIWGKTERAREKNRERKGPREEETIKQRLYTVRFTSHHNTADSGVVKSTRPPSSWLRIPPL